MYDNQLRRSVFLLERGIRSFPEGSEEADKLAEAVNLILDVLGEHIAGHYLAGKRREWEEYQTRVSSWELEKYLVIY